MWDWGHREVDGVIRRRGHLIHAVRIRGHARLLLAHAAAWERLSQEDHGLLCGLPAPHGPLFAWLDSQVHEHGPLAWGSLREALKGHPNEALALRLMEELPAGAASTADTAAELRDLLDRMLVEQLALAGAAAELYRLGAGRIADAFLESRLAAGWRSTYGMLDSRFDSAYILDLLYPPAT